LRILFAHNRYMIRGGEDESREQEMACLRSRGHDVFEYVVDSRDIQQGNMIATGIGSIWSGPQYRHMTELIRGMRPDILKVDNYFPVLSPSIFEAAKTMGVATVFSVRNYRLICPAATLYRDGRVCTDCVGSNLAIPAILHKCYRDSYAQSSAVVLSNAYAHMRGTWVHSVDRFVAVSQFVKNQLVLGGFAAEKIVVKPNSIADTGAGDGSGKFAMYVGRLTEEKGVRTLLAAWEKIGPSLPLKIIGDGPLESAVAVAAKQNPGIEYLQRRPIAEVCEQLGNAQVLIFPSQWLEPFGRTIIEAYSKGTPVIAADTPPMRDMIEDGRSGLLFRAGSSDDLAQMVLSSAVEHDKLTLMRPRARDLYLEKYSPESNYAQMMRIFEGVLAKGAAKLQA